jgi:hypothetical protein
MCGEARLTPRILTGQLWTFNRRDVSNHESFHGSARTGESGSWLQADAGTLALANTCTDTA